MGKLRQFSGCIYHAEVNDYGVVQSKWKKFGDVDPLGLMISEEIIKRLSRQCDTEGLVIGSRAKPAETSGSMTCHEYLPANIAIAMKATVAANTVSSSTPTGVAVTLGKFDEWVDIGTKYLSAVVVKDATDTTTYVLGTDYQLNAALGMINPIDGGAIAEDEVVHVSGVGAANTDNVFTIGAGTSTTMAIKGNMLDSFSGLAAELYLRKVRVTSKNEVVFVSSDDTDYEKLEFDLVPEVPEGQTDYGTFGGAALS